METLKQDAINAISKLPDTAGIDEIMYRLYVIDKVRKGTVFFFERTEDHYCAWNSKQGNKNCCAGS